MTLDGLDHTHDPALTSWVSTANDPQTPFPIQNLPFGVFRRRGSSEAWRGGVAIGDRIVDLPAVARHLQGPARTAAEACAAPTLNGLLALGPAAWQALRVALSENLRTGAKLAAEADSVLVVAAEAEMAVPVAIGDYTDFFASIHHARRTSRIVRGDNDVRPNFHWLPVGYHGRASSIVVSDTPVRRPLGQFVPADASAPIFAPTQRLDFELEVAAIVGVGNASGESVPIAQAEQHLFGLVIMNDWSARDIQAYEAMPLGPFLGKSFATSISPWIVTMAALAPFRTPLEPREAGAPKGPAHLDQASAAARAGISLALEARIGTAAMREQGAPSATVTKTDLRSLYWSFAQMLAHHTSNGCNLRVGDLIGTGTVSGPEVTSAACLLELTEGGRKALDLSAGESRVYLQDGDEVVLTGRCENGTHRAVGFGECRGRIVPALT